MTRGFLTAADPAGVRKPRAITPAAIAEFG
jgi:hypothetical protein